MEFESVFAVKRTRVLSLSPIHCIDASLTIVPLPCGFPFNPQAAKQNSFAINRHLPQNSIQRRSTLGIFIRPSRFFWRAQVSSELTNPSLRMWSAFHGPGHFGYTSRRWFVSRWERSLLRGNERAKQSKRQTRRKSIWDHPTVG